MAGNGVKSLKRAIGTAELKRLNSKAELEKTNNPIRKTTYPLSYVEDKPNKSEVSLSKKETGEVSVSGNNPSMLGRAGLIARGSARQTFGGINTSGAIASTYLGRAMDRTMDSLGLGKDTENNQKILNELKASYEKANDKQKAMLEPTIKYYEAKVAGTEKQYAEQWHRNQIAEAQKMTEKGSQDIEKAKQGLGAVGQFAVDVGAGAAQLGMSALAGYGSALAPMMISAAGNSAGEALNEGATLNQATAYGALSGAIEGATEKLFSFGKPFKSLVGKGLGDEAVENLARRATFNFVKSASGRELANGLVRTGLAATTEGAEEMISSLVNPWLKNLTYTDGEKVDVREVLYSGLVGSAVGGLLGGAGQISESRNYSKVGKAMQDLDATESVIQTGLDSNPDTDSYVFANRIRDIQSRGGEISNQDIGRLYKANRDTIKAEEEAKRKQGDRTYIVDRILQNAEKTSSGQAQSSTMGIGSTTRISDAVHSLGDNGAKALEQFYKGETDFDSYYAGFSRYYEAGVSNVPFKMINTEYAKNISEVVKHAAYSAGQNDAKISLKQEMKDSKFAKVYGKEGELILDDVAKSLKPRLQETLNTVAKVSGTKIKIVESISAGDSGAGANGYYKSSKGIIYIAKDADNPLFVVAKHEITHHMQKVAPKEYRAYRDYVMSVISDGQAVDTLVEQKRAQYASAGQNLSVEEAMDEIVADYTEQIIKDEKVLNEFISKGEKSVVQKFFDSVREFINRVKKAFKGDKTKMDAAAEETYGATISELERAEQLWLDALKATKKKAEKAKTDIARADNGDVQYSLNKNFATEFDEWMKLGEGEKRKGRFLIGTTSDALKSIGVKDYKIYWDKASLAAKMNKHKELTPYTVKQLPNVIENPILVLQSSSVENSITVWGEVYADDGKPIMVAIRLNADTKTGTVSDYAVITSAYKRPVTQLQNFLNDINNILYLDENKKRTDTWLQSLGLQLPPLVSRYGSLRDVTLSTDSKPQTAETVKKEKIYSIKDSTGKTLTQQQAEYFKDSKVRDENGNLKIMYHGTPNAGFTVFRTGAYFTENGEYADKYKAQGASSLGYKKTADNPDTYAVYLNITKPFDTRNKKERDIFNNEYYGKWGMGTPLMDSGLPDWMDGIDLQEFLEEKGYDYDGLILDDGGVGGYGDEVISRGLSYVTFYPEQVKSIDNKKPTADSDVRFSLKSQQNLIKENQKLKDYNEYLKEQMKLTKDIKQDKKAMEKLSKGILKDYSSEMDSAELLRQLNEVYSYIANSDSLSWDELKPMARRVAGNILSQSVAIVDEAYQLYKDLITGLSRTRINLSKDYRNGLKGGYEEFRKANLGKFRLVNSGGRNVDVLYNELADTYPELFDAEKYTHPVDQLEHIAEVLDGLKPVEENPYSYDMRNATEWLANEIIDRYFEVPQAKKTFADKQADKLTKEKIKGAEKLANQKERYENKIADIKLHSKQRIAEAVKREKAAKWDKVAQVKQAQREKESRLSDRRKRSMYVNKIRKHAAKISKMLLNPTETSHVPEPLRKPVAEFLSLFDMTSDGMEEKSIQKFQSLREAYLKIADSADATLMDIDPDLDANLEQIIEAFKGNGDLRISNMSAKDTETLYRAVMAVERSIYSYNKLMNDEKQTTIADYGESAMEELATKHPFREKRGVARVVGDTLNMDMVAPAEFFDELGGTMKSLYDDIRKGFDKKISNLEIARAYMEKLTEGIALKEITGNKARTTSFELSGGKIELTKAQVMSLYLLNKQPDAQEHIYTGGIKAAPIVARGEKGRRARIQKSFEVIKVTPEDVDEIIGSMSKEEKALADGIGKFFTDYTAEWGNEVSEKLYGYRKFTVENYFPIVSDKNYINQVFGETTDVTLKNMGSTKSRIKGANNPIIIEDVIDVFTRQVDSMASYNAFVIPLNDIQKVYNYKNINGSVKQSIEKKFGVRANKYFSTFITDMNGGGKFDGGTGTFNFMLGKYKQAKMGLNLRVVLQQPTSYLRAAAVINPKYLTKAAASPKKIDYNLVMKYAPIARWKDWGHFSLDTSKSMKSIIMEKKEMSDYTMALAKQADRLTWGRLWKAAEYEIQDKHPELRKGSEEYYRAVGERFSEIIDKTQVVDSTLHRPQIMRRKDGLTRMTMSFMSETMRSYNLLRTALRNAKVNPGKEATKLAFAAVTAYMTQVIVNHIITGFVDTLRGDDDDQFFIDKLMGLFDGDDDDDDETVLTFEQRWIKHFVDNLINEPLSMFPAVKDVWSVVQGFSVERMDMASIGDLFSAVKRTFSDKYTPIFKMADVGSKVLDMFGVPASSFKREVATGAKLALDVTGNPVMEYKANKYLYNVKSNKKMYMDLLYKTMKSGDMESYYAIVEDMVNSGVPGSDIESAMRSRAKKDSEMGTDISNFDSTLAGIGIKYQDPEEKKEDDKFKVEDLDGAGYAEYSSIKQDILNQLISDFKTRGFGDLDEETANDILSAAYAYSESIALQEASDGAYEEDTKWILNAQEWADNLDVSLGQLIEYKAEYGDGVLDNKKTIKASELGVLDKYMDAYEFYNDIEPVYVTDSNGNYILDKNGNRKTEDEYKKKAFREYMNDADLTSEEYDDIWYLFYKRK